MIVMSCYRYIIAVSLGHVTPGFPYISDDGTQKPESNIFSQMLNMTAFLVGLTVFVRYKQVEQYYRDHLSPESAKILRWNLHSLYLGWAAAFGLSLVANFRENEVFAVHVLGAMLCFGAGISFTWLQTLLSFRMHPLVNTLRMARLRLAMCTIMSVCFLVSSILGPISFSYFTGDNFYKWTSKDGGWVPHVISSSCEWVMAVMLNIFILTFTREFHKISMTSPRIIFLVDPYGFVGDDSSFDANVGSISGTLPPMSINTNRSDRSNVSVVHP